MEIDHVKDISEEECRRRRLWFNCKKPGHSWSQCGNTVKDKKRRGRARPVDHVKENKRSDEDTTLFDRIKTCNVETVDYKYSSALIRKTAHINQKTVKVLVDGESSVNLFDPESQRKPWVCVIF